MDLSDVVTLLVGKGIKLVTAESCTAGLIASKVADVPGAGALLDCAFIAYSGWAKECCLSVSPETLREHNLTSEAVAIEMALGALQRCRANLAIANTGVSDDTDPDIPAGTQCFAWVFDGQRSDGEDRQFHILSETRRFEGDRNEIRERAAEYALQQIPFVLVAAGAA